MTNQQYRLLIALRRGPCTTGYCRNVLGIGDPATRVFELKEDGWNVDTDMVEVRAPKNPDGKARVAEYSLPDTAKNRRKLAAFDRQEQRRQVKRAA